MMRFSQDIASRGTASAHPSTCVSCRGDRCIHSCSLHQSGIHYFNIQFRIPADQYPADYTDGDPDGTILYYNRIQAVDSPQNRYRWRQAMTRLGGPLSMEIDVNSLIGLGANIEVTLIPGS